MASLGDGKLRVRMYHVGFGDSFLVSFPKSGGGHQHALIDFGVHPQGDLGRLGDILTDIENETEGQLALVLATHEHADHISGFGKFAARFGKLKVSEVWMPWTSDPNDPQANALKKKKLALLETLAPRLAASKGPAYQALLNARPNETALTTLHEGMGGKPRVRYLSAGATLATPAGIAGLSARILGPPQDPKLLAKMDPPDGQHYFCAPVAGGPAFLPFDKRWDAAQPALSRKDQAVVKALLRSDPDGLAFALDSAINNTSVVAMLSFGAEHLLFAGDAQWGNWKGWIDGDDAAALLKTVTFYKVAHHGSLNATPKEALEAMPKNQFVAMMSTQNTPWPSIPRPGLVDALDTLTNGQLARSDNAKAPSAFTAFKLGIDYIVKG